MFSSGSVTTVACMRHTITAVLVALAAVVAAVPASAQPRYRVTVFTHVPDPGHPFGIAVHKGNVVVSTSAGQPEPWMVNTKGERVFTFDSHGHLKRTVKVDEGPVSVMGLGGLAFDGRNRLYVVDMNQNVIWRYARTGPPKAYAAESLPYSATMFATSMWNDVVFDRRGNAYVSNTQRGILRIPPGGAPEVWFSDPRLFGAGPFQQKIDAEGRYLYFAYVLSGFPDRFGSASIYRLPLKAHPTADDLEEIYRFNPEPSDVTPRGFVERGPFQGPLVNGLAIGRSGRIYVTVSGRNQIAVLSRTGKLIRTISSDLFHWPQYLAFSGDKLLITNIDERADSVPDTWTVLSVDVGDTGVPPYLPRNIP